MTTCIMSVEYSRVQYGRPIGLHDTPLKVDVRRVNWRPWPILKPSPPTPAHYSVFLTTLTTPPLLHRYPRLNSFAPLRSHFKNIILHQQITTLYCSTSTQPSTLLHCTLALPSSYSAQKWKSLTLSPLTSLNAQALPSLVSIQYHQKFYSLISCSSSSYQHPRQQVQNSAQHPCFLLLNSEPEIKFRTSIV